MKNFISKVPVPIAGLMLALAACGNLVASYGLIYKNIFGSLSFIIFMMLTLKLVLNTSAVLESLNNPVVASVSPTYSMGIMILSTYLKPYMSSFAQFMWFFGIALHIALILYFTFKYILNFNINKVFPSYFVVYVGIVVGSVTAPAFNQALIGRGLFWFGFVCYLTLLPIVFYRVLKVKNIPEPALPTLTILAAPASLCLAGYMSSFKIKNLNLVYFLMGLSLTMLVIALLYLPKLLKLKFYPSYSAFTFPLVISGIAIKKTNAFLIASNSQLTFLKFVVKFEEALAVLIVLYVLIRYIKFLFTTTRNDVQTSKAA